MRPWQEFPVPLWVLLSHPRPCALQGLPPNHSPHRGHLPKLYLSLPDLNLGEPALPSQALPALGAAPEKPARGGVEVAGKAALPSWF